MITLIRKGGRLVNASVQAKKEHVKVPDKGYSMHKARHNLGPNKVYFADSKRPCVFKYDTIAIASKFEGAMGVFERNKHVKRIAPLIADKLNKIAREMNRTIGDNSRGLKPCYWDVELNKLVRNLALWFNKEIPDFGKKLSEVVDAWNS